MQTADNTTRLKVLTAVAQLEYPDIDRRNARKLAEQGFVKPLGRNTATVLAYVNHGRWVADCVCNGSELVGGPDMVCGSCGMESTVKYPGPKTREKIEAALKPRDLRHQNWLPDETVAELVAQNIDNGIFPDDLRSPA